LGPDSADLLFAAGFCSLRTAAVREEIYRNGHVFLRFRMQNCVCSADEQSIAAFMSVVNGNVRVCHLRYKIDPLASSPCRAKEWSTSYNIADMLTLSYVQFSLRTASESVRLSKPPCTQARNPSACHLAVSALAIARDLAPTNHHGCTLVRCTHARRTHARRALSLPCRAPSCTAQLLRRMGVHCVM
jgi:hypothetical protein